MTDEPETCNDASCAHPQHSNIEDDADLELATAKRALADLGLRYADACSELRRLREDRDTELAALLATATDVQNALLHDVRTKERAEAFRAGWDAAIERAADRAESFEPECESCPRGVAGAIRALEPTP